MSITTGGISGEISSIAGANSQWDRLTHQGHSLSASNDTAVSKEMFILKIRMA